MSNLPQHVAIVMDGNGRWASRRKLPRVAGHRAGAKTVREIVEHAGNLGVDVLTLLKPYCAWTKGVWDFSPTKKYWKEIQNTTKDISQLREFLYAHLMQAFRNEDRKAVSNE